MTFLVSHDALTARQLAARVDPGDKILKAGDHAALADARAMLESAREQADALLAGAQQAFDAERQRGYDDGHAEALMNQAEKMIETVGRTVEYFAGIENEMVELVMSALRKIIDGFDDREKIMTVVRNALAVVRNQKQMTLRLHPGEVETVREQVNELLAAYPGVGYLDIMADARLERGACILESEIGIVEASLDGQLRALHGAFTRMLGSRV